MRRWIWVGLLPCAIACGDGTGPADIELDSIRIEPFEVTVPVNVRLQLTARLFPGLPQQIAGSCSAWWSSDDPAVVAVDTTAFCQPGWATIATAREGVGTVTVSFGGVAAAALVHVLPGLPFVSVSAGATHTCALTAGGAVHCWGTNAHGELGVDPAADTCGEPCRNVPKEAVDGARRFVTVASGVDRSCAVGTDGVTYCWGRGYGWAPAAVPGGHRFVSLAHGGAHTCGLTSDGAAYCWGANADGQLGDGTTRTSMSPVRVAGTGALAVIAPSSRHSCALDIDGIALCWGFNGNGELGDGTKQSSLAPVKVAGGLVFTALSAGDAHTCGLASGGAAYCWGSDQWGSLGNGVGVPSDTVCAYSAPHLVPCSAEPLAVSGASRFHDLRVGVAGYRTCAVTSAGAAVCWGVVFGPASCGGDPPMCLPTFAWWDDPKQVPGPAQYVTAGGGVWQTCWMGRDGAAYCWSNSIDEYPVRVPGQPSGWRSVSAARHGYNENTLEANR